MVVATRVVNAIAKKAFVDTKQKENVGQNENKKRKKTEKKKNGDEKDKTKKREKYKYIPGSKPPPPPQLRCHMCEKQLLCRSKLISHYAVRHYRRYLESRCDGVSRGLLGPDGGAACPRCPSQFRHYSSLLEHVARVHVDMREVLPAEVVESVGSRYQWHFRRFSSSELKEADISSTDTANGKGEPAVDPLDAFSEDSTGSDYSAPRLIIDLEGADVSMDTGAPYQEHSKKHQVLIQFYTLKKRLNVKYRY
jgi:hypothetical protein